MSLITHSLFLTFFTLVTTSVLAAAPPVKEGLILWFDASAESGNRKAQSLPGISHLQPVDFLVDQTTGKHYAFQPSPERRPLLYTDNETGFLKFDGKDDFLIMSSQRQITSAMTLFVLAAPKSNQGNFRALIAAAEMGKNDYTSGFNLDFGPLKTENLSVINAELAGSSGFQDLLRPGLLNAAERPFGEFHVFTLRTQAGTNGTEFFLDGFKGGDKKRSESTIRLDHVTLGSRFYSNDPSQPPYAQDFLDGAIAEVLVYDRALNDGERQNVEQALLKKTVQLQGLLSGARGHALEPVKDPPLVQMLVPGFTVHELPLKLNNLNNVRYRHDGKLVGMGYDGRIHVLEDTDGDGLEDKSTLFWDKQTLRGPMGIALTPKDAPRGDGVFVASKGKISLILDQDRDGRAEEERILTTGWKEGFTSIDTLGLAIDPKDGSIYFGLGCANFTDAYLVNPVTGKAGYNIHDTPGTIQRLSPDFKTRETVCTGVRFTCGLAFNRDGDLFATDQEGATWMPNGNPLDELLHIEKGKHYGFPPRHPKHLPNVQDEPSVIEFGPQHQSTVGLVFNEGVYGGPSFGPAHWEGDALICGESRGKLWRTKLAKTPMGYVAQSHLIACLNMLTVDACVTPKGDLIVACHSGPPDWGTGPAGEGKLFKIRYAGRSIPQPVTAWASAPDEFRIAFDRPLNPADWSGLQGHIKVEAGKHVSPGDRFELLRPGYQVVRDQLATPRRWVDVLGLTLGEENRTLVLRVHRQSKAENYAVTLPLPESWKQNDGLRQHPQIDLQVTLNGITASLVSNSNRETQCVLPHPSHAVSSLLTAGSFEHEQFLSTAAGSKKIAFGGLVDTSNPYVPAVQPGSKLDWDMSKDSFASTDFTVQSDQARGNSSDFSVPHEGNWRRLNTNVVLSSVSSSNGLYLSNSNGMRHRLAPSRLYLPWATPNDSDSKKEPQIQARTDVKGNWLRGKKLFAGEAGCITCHQVRNEGIAFGPDLSNLVHRDRSSVLKDILQPSATINPDQVGTLIELNDSTSVSGITRILTDDKLVLALPAGAEAEIPRTRIKSMSPLKTSLMPERLADRLTSEQMEDLLTFLLQTPLEPASISRTDPPLPPPRQIADVQQVLTSNQNGSESTEPPLRILLCSGPKDHGPDEHDYPLWLSRWSRLLALSEEAVVTTSEGFPSAEQLAQADVVVFYNGNPGWNQQYAEQLDQYHRRGGGVVYIHYALEGGKEPAAAAERMGLAFTFGSKFRHGEFELRWKQPDHPIAQGLPPLRFTDETYWNMRGDVSRLSVIATASEENADRPLIWTLEREKSRIFSCIPGHYTWTFDDPLYRIIVLRGICWAAKQTNLDRLSELALIGARVRP